MHMLTVDSCDVGLSDIFCWYHALWTLFAVKLPSLAFILVLRYCLIVQWNIIVWP